RPDDDRPGLRRRSRAGVLRRHGAPLRRFARRPYRFGRADASRSLLRCGAPTRGLSIAQQRNAAMPVQFVLLPLFVEVLLTFGLLLATGFARRSDLTSGAVHPRDIALGQLGWTARTQQLGNSFNNQFQLPLLFYVLTILAVITRHADIIFVV